MVRKNSWWEWCRELQKSTTHHQHSKVGEVVAPAVRLAASRHRGTTVAVPAPRAGCTRERESGQ